MKQLKHLLFSTSFLIVSLVSSAQEEATIRAEDLKLIIGNWTGSLTYLDYKSNKPYTMPSDIGITWDEKSSKLIISFMYPKEPQANSVDTVTISSDGRFFDLAKVVSRRKLDNGNIEIITQTIGKDGNDNKEASIKQTYIISDATYSIRKDVQFAGESVWIKRNESIFTKRKTTN